MFDNFNKIVILLISLIKKAFIYKFFNLSLIKFFVESKTLSSFLIIIFVFLLFNLFLIFALA